MDSDLVKIFSCLTHHLMEVALPEGQLESLNPIISLRCEAELEIGELKGCHQSGLTDK